MNNMSLVGTLRINSNINITPTNLEPIGIGHDNTVIFKFRQNDKINYSNGSFSKKIFINVFFEILNGSELWAFNINKIYNYTSYIANTYIYEITFTINPVKELINEYTGFSISLTSLLMDNYVGLPLFTNTDLKDQSIIPFNDPFKMENNFKIKLYDYQERTLGKMINMENNNTDFNIEYSTTFDFNGIQIYFDPVTNLKCDNKKQFKITTNGGVLCDEMGLGKTISSIALIVSNPLNKIKNISKPSNSTFNKINSKATLIVCPSHLTKQWESEIKRCSTKLNVLTILTKTDYNRLTFNDYIENDVIITSHQFLMNFKFYPTLHYKQCTASSYNFEERNMLIKNYIDKTLQLPWEEVKNQELPIFEFFNFHRLILDEGHEIFGEMLSSGTLSIYMSKWLSNISSTYRWYVSGTPFINFKGIENCARFINLKLDDIEREITIDYSKNDTSSYQILKSVMNKNYIWKEILNKVCIRHRKTDVENQIKIPGYEERIIWLRFTDIERQLYEAKKGKVSDLVLQQLCCHPLIVESSKKIFGDVEVDLSVMQDKLIEYHKNNYEVYKTKLSKLDPTRHEYHMLKKTYETQMSESKYLFTILDKMKKPEILDEENCSICMDNLDNPAITACGHIFCYDCLKMCLGEKKRCPLCKADLTGKDLMVMNIKKDEYQQSNPLVEKYGSKLGKLISVIRVLASQEDNRIIVFSQWDDMLSLIGKTLAENEIENCFVKGNVWSRNAAIRKFKNGKNDSGADNKVIMLSLKNAASGTNLTEATHIFFVEPINASKEECKAIEGQAIARACRVGQKHTIVLMRILIENTIEETIYRNNYNKDIVVEFKEPNYFCDKKPILIETSKVEEVIAEKPKVKRIIKKKIVKADDIEV
jgi:SWI/SNF-related matrix-associated actin-dependent regulator of chromatin subfamily A3